MEPETRTNKKLKLSVILPCRNGADTIGTQLEALSRQQWDGEWEVVFIDNCSDDGTAQVVERYKDRIPSLQMVSASQRPSRAYARNLGCKTATGDAFLFCDADDEVAPNWLNAMGNALQEHEFVACRVDSRKLNDSWIFENISPQDQGVQPMPYFSGMFHCGGGTAGVHRSLHEKVGGFDENFRWLSDTDYSLRLQLAGAKIYFVKETAIHVRYRPNYRRMFRQAYNYGSFCPKIYKRGLELGLPKPTNMREQAIRNWKRLVMGSLYIRDRNERVRWIWQLGWLLGRVHGSIRDRVMAV